ncbi:MAG: ATP synthase subunit I [Acidobacteria bacterium]|nr:ATP synthase subunit I [Acidobacteriota bacterium]
MKRFLWVLAATGSVALGIANGLSWGISFATGALLAIASFQYTHRFVNSIGSEPAAKPTNTKAVLVGLRYLFLAGLLYLLASTAGLNVPAALLGLLTPAAAALIEMLYQLGTLRKRGNQ